MKKFLNQLSIMLKLRLLTVVSILGFVLLSTYLVWDVYRNSLHDRQELVRQTVQAASGVLQWAHQLEISGKMPREQAQATAKQALAQMRYGNKEYFWINDMQGTMLMHPVKPELEGQGG